MIEMTDERAAEVLAAHNEWRRYDGFPGEPGAPAMGDPAELGRAIDHVVSRLRSQPLPTRPPSAPVGVEGLARRIESYHWDVADKSVAAQFAAELRGLAQQPAAGDGCHCGTCTCNPNMTPAVRFDLSPAQQEGAIREHLIRLGWTPPKRRPYNASGSLSEYGVFPECDTQPKGDK